MDAVICGKSLPEPHDPKVKDAQLFV